LDARFGVRARDFGPWLTISICLWVATAMFGCSAQRAPQNQYCPPAPARSISPVPPPGRLEVASWYGPAFVGHLTSDGEAFNPNALTAASKTLPIGSRVRVTNPDNGLSVVAGTINRRPYVRGRSLDLSSGAARHIGVTDRGVCRVRVRVLRVTSRDAPAARPAHGPETPEVSGSNAAFPPYIRRTTYHRRVSRSSRRRSVRNGRTERAP